MTREDFNKAVVIQHRRDGDTHMYKATLSFTAVEFVRDFRMSPELDRMARENLLQQLWHHIFEDRRHLAAQKMDEYMRYHHPMTEYDKAEKARNELMALIAWK